MTYRGHVENGMVVLDANVELPEGALVQVAVVENRIVLQQDVPETEPANPALMHFAGAAKDLPPDAARNLDRYLYGQPDE
jgi:hypothetical protein